MPNRMMFKELNGKKECVPHYNASAGKRLTLKILKHLGARGLIIRRFWFLLPSLEPKPREKRRCH